MHTVNYVPIAFFAFLALIVLVPAWFRHQTRIELVRLSREAMARGESVDPALLARINPAPKTDFVKWFSLLTLLFGLSGMAVGVGLAISGQYLAVGDAETRAGMSLGAMVTGLSGAGHTALGLIALVALRTGRAVKDSVVTAFSLFCLYIGVGALGVGVALALGAGTVGAQLEPAEHGVDGIMIGALIVGLSGIGTTAVGLLGLKFFANDKES